VKAPIKLIKEGDSLKGIFNHKMNFIEAENSAGYPTTMFTKPWTQFPPEGFEAVTDDIMTLFVEWYNSRPETIQAFLDGEIDKLFLDSWDKEAALKYLTEKLEDYPHREK